MSSGIKKYFAAANTFYGFKSIFDEIFKRDAYEKVYVIKGGPGTGKSSLMKKFSSYFAYKECQVEEIYCSSDPNSLDGVIIEKNGRRIAMLDGTAPHQTDSVLPGVCDEIIDLANGLDKRILGAQREKVLMLLDEKKKCYNSAYNYLAIAGKSEEIICSLYSSNFLKEKAYFAAESILKDIPLKFAGITKHIFLSSFGKAGFKKSEDNLSNFERKIKVSGDKIQSLIFITFLANTLSIKNANHTVLPYPLDPDFCEGILIPDESTAIIYDESGEINSKEYFDLCRADEEKIKKARQLKKDALDEAVRWFSVASDMHFRLEEIYGSAMNYEYNDEIFAKKTIEIENILENTI